MGLFSTGSCELSPKMGDVAVVYLCENGTGSNLQDSALYTFSFFIQSACSSNFFAET